ncbi:MAG: GAF domain-containing protein [Pseudoclavibacter sp.]|nr:GAF domain-containing protein [Pseudoclavibacter sp.]
MRSFPARTGDEAPVGRAEQERIRRAHARLRSGRQPSGEEGPERLVRPVVRDSWRRSLAHLGSPDGARPGGTAPPDGFERYRSGHPLASVLPVLRRLLVEPAERTGMLVATADESGRLLWVEGDREARRRAARMDFADGADWSEAAVGTSAPGTALVNRAPVQIAGSEHFAPAVHPWHCTAVPIRDPRGALLGVVDLTGGDEAASPHSLALLRAAVAAAEAELRIAELRRAASAGPGRTIVLGPRDGARPLRRRPPAWAPPREQGVRLRSLGRERTLLEWPGGSEELSGRHGEIATLLAWHREGLSADELGTMLFGESVRPVTLRAEIVRLRRVLERCGLRIESRPYRLLPTPETDVRAMLEAVDHGHHRRALELHAGPLLPASDAPGIEALREEIEASLREQILSGGSLETLLRYAEGPGAERDEGVLRELLRRLPARSPRRARLVVRLEALQRETAPGAPV